MRVTRRTRHQAGMTLVEVMAVLFIVGLTAGLVTLTLPQRPTEEQAAAQAFGRVLTEAQEQAIFAGQPIGLQLTRNGYSLVQWRQDGWRPTGRPERLARNLDIIRVSEGASKPQEWPDLVFDPTGIVEPTDFQLSGRGVRIDISLTEQGEVQFAER